MLGAKRGDYSNETWMVAGAMLAMVAERWQLSLTLNKTHVPLFFVSTSFMIIL